MSDESPTTTTSATSSTATSGPAPDEDASFVERLPRNVALQFLERVSATPDAEAFRFPVGDEVWESITWGRAGERITRLAAGLVSLGIEPEQRVGVVSGTRYEWILADLAIMCSGAATTTVYPSTNSEGTAYILADSDSRLIFAEDQAQLDKVLAHREELPQVLKVVCFADVDVPDDAADWVIGLADLEAAGEQVLADRPTVIDDIAEAIEPDQLATLIYTSGTTGNPKGVRLKHRSWVYEGEATKAQGILSVDDLQFLWLPMAHSFGKVLLSTQLAVGFPTAIDGRVDKIVDNLAVVKPTFMGAAPRIFEKAYGRILSMQAAEGGLKEKIFNRAFAVGLEKRRRERAGEGVPLPLRVQHLLFDRLVFAKVRERFGGRVRFFISGSAALNREVAEWFDAAGITILEGYGLTETSAGSFVNRPQLNKFGTVGRPFPGSEVQIAADGEVLFRGPGVMDGYHNLPEQTAETLTDDGWLRTGDIGELDDDGYLKITDRKKDLFKTSGGKYIAPSSIESQFKAICPYVSQFVVIGSDRNYVTALITLDPDQIVTWAEQHGLGGRSYSELVTSKEAAEMVEGYVEQLNARLNRWETVKRHVVLEEDLSIESGELTPSLKVKRKVVEERHSDEIAGLYS